MSLISSLNTRSLLQEGWIKIAFQKKDGSIREMIATTNLGLVPEQFHPKTRDSEKQLEASKEPAVDPLYVVFEKDNGWRSFRESQLVSVTVILKGHLLT